MKILIATGIYPPNHGGPAYYAKSLKEEFEKLGHAVTVRTYTVEHSLPIGIRHLVYFFKTLPAYLHSDWTLTLDTFSVGFPIACMTKLFGGRTILRTGGDFLWEQYVERTHELVLFSKFYDRPRKFSLKEKIIFRLTKFALRTFSLVVFSTAYQRDVWMKSYEMDPVNVHIIENRYDKIVEPLVEVKEKRFVYCAARDIYWKNADIVRAAFAKAQKIVPEISLEFLADVTRDEAIEKIRSAYACMLVSLGDISPNYVLRALSFGKPIIFTNENGLRDRIGDTVLYVDPLDETAITNAIVAMCYEDTQRMYQEKARAFSFEHSYAEIAKEFLTLIAQ